jgi:hypothetical protein
MRRRACRDVNHNFQPQRSHLNCSSGFSLEAVLPQRGHFIVHICVKGPSGVTLKIWNVDSIAASCIDFSSASVGMLFGLYALPVPRRLMRSQPCKINQLRFPECCVEFRTNVTVPGNFSQRHCHLSYQNQETQENWVTAACACGAGMRLRCLKSLLPIFGAPPEAGIHFKYQPFAVSYVSSRISCENTADCV